MKVVCNSGSRFLTKGKIYDVIYIDGGMYQLRFDSSPETGRWNSNWFSKYNFETLEEKRNRILEELGI